MLQKFKCISLISRFTFCEHFQSSKTLWTNVDEQEREGVREKNRSLIFCFVTIFHFYIHFFDAENFGNKSNALEVHIQYRLVWKEWEVEKKQRVQVRKIELLMPKSKVVRFKFCIAFNIQLKVTKTPPTFSYLFLHSAYYCAISS